LVLYHCRSSEWLASRCGESRWSINLFCRVAPCPSGNESIDTSATVTKSHFLRSTTRGMARTSGHGKPCSWMMQPCGPNEGNSTGDFVFAGNNTHAGMVQLADAAIRRAGIAKTLFMGPRRIVNIGTYHRSRRRRTTPPEYAQGVPRFLHVLPSTGRPTVVNLLGSDLKRQQRNQPLMRKTLTRTRSFWSRMLSRLTSRSMYGEGSVSGA
jgi:hypothetical protein